ncbi:NAD(P)/FAD-dependent oxidoreductase [Kordiimonas pumila]|uniref:NAD(P)/FAD-dependent oxidoreductase n=1 Tax=Kordiimonas pumila TaxID=2161677 RepID=A0ABV7D751_9PROT|nr:FAD-binding oxidoreductase [Kordiimonas pumila]
MMQKTDFLIIGAGIAGASTAFHLAGKADVLVIDMEDQAGYHTTGRSAAFYAETYGGPAIQPLTTASKGFYYNQPVGFADTEIKSPLGALYIFKESQRAIAQQLYAVQKKALPDIEMLDEVGVLKLMPALQPGLFAGGIYDPNCCRLDVAALHGAYIKGAKKAGVKFMLGAGLEAASYDGSLWHVKTRTGDIQAKVLVNAAGAWGDVVADIAGINPVGLKPLRRTIITVPNPKGKPFEAGYPVTLDIEDSFYFKPEGTGYLVSPADETLSAACDAQPELEDIAYAAEYFGQATGTEVTTILSKWAGLRTFAPDRVPVIGHAPDNPAFFWNVGQGGYGIQTAPAWSELVASMLLGINMPEYMRAACVDPSLYSPARF